MSGPRSRDPSRDLGRDLDGQGTVEPDPGREPVRWLVQGEPVRSGDVATFIAERDDIELIRTIAADVLLLRMGPEQADILKARFGAALLIARDRPIPQPLQPPFDL